MDPTPEQIRQACLELQKTWTEFDYRLRSGLVRGEPRDWSFYGGRGHSFTTEFGWSPPQYLVHHGEIGRAVRRRYRETRVWERIGG